MWKRTSVTMIALCSALGCSSTGLGIARQDLPKALAPIYDRAEAGDKRAQMELGLAFVEGKIVDRDCKKARRLLKLAANDSGGAIWVYSPPVGGETTGKVIPIDRGPKQQGIQSAQELLSDPGFCPLSR